MSDTDLNKLKVVELKAELQQRGLDTKGNKPVLIDRLKEALEKEGKDQPGGAAPQEEGSNGSLEAADDAFAEGEELDEEAEEAMLAEDQGPEVQEPEAQPETSEPEAEPEDEPVAAEPAPVQSPPKAPVQSPLKAVVQSPPKAVVQSPPKAVVQSPPKAVVPSPVKEVAQSPPKAPVQQTQSPVKTTPVPQPSPQKLPTSPIKQEPTTPVAPAVNNSEQPQNSSPQKEAEKPEIKSEPEEKDEPMQTDDKIEKPEEVKKEEERGKKRPHSPEPVKEVKIPQEDEPEYDPNTCLLSWYDSDLNLVIDKSDFLKAEPMTKGGFGYCWAGARASFGVKEGKAFFEVMVDKYLEVPHLENETNPHVLRVGWSVPTKSMQLGEEELTYGYGGTGKISTNCKFSDYGKTFEEGSVVGAFLDMSGDDVTMSYTVNGEDQGVAFTVAKADLKEQALFPHVLTKNCSFNCNFGQDEPWFPAADSTFSQIGKLTVDKEVVLGAKRPASKADCEVIMMVGIPGCGKSFWANKHAAENAEKCYNILGTNNLIEKMKVMGLPRRKNYAGRWDELISSCTSCFNRLLSIAATRRRNYILDQTNVYSSARQRKMQPFKGFVRTAVVVVPSEEELKSRVAKTETEEGKEVPDNTVQDMKANMGVPVKGDIFDEVRFVELDEAESTKMVEQYVKEANAAGHFKKEDAKHPRYEQKQNSGGGGYRSGSGNANSRYLSGNSNSRYGGGGGDYRNQRYPQGGQGGGGYQRRDNRDGYQPRGGGGGFRGASGGGGGSWRGGRDNRDSRDTRGYGGGGRPDFNRRGGGGGGADYRRDQKDSYTSRDRGGYTRPAGDRDRRTDRYGQGGAWASGGGASNYNASSGYGTGGGGGGYASYGSGQQQQRGYNQNQQYGSYSSYSSYPSQQQGYSQTTQQNWSNYNSQQQPAQQQSYSGGWQQYGGYGAASAQTQQTYQQQQQQQGYTGYQQNQSSGSYTTAQK